MKFKIKLNQKNLNKSAINSHPKISVNALLRQGMEMIYRISKNGNHHILNYYLNRRRANRAIVLDGPQAIKWKPFPISTRAAQGMLLQAISKISFTDMFDSIDLSFE